MAGTPHSVSIKIEGMHCGACVRSVTGALARVPEAKTVSVVIGGATIETQDTRTIELAVAAIEAAGFEASIEEAN